MLASMFQQYMMRDTLNIGTASGGSWGSDPGGETWTYSSTDVKCMIKTMGQSEAIPGAGVPVGDVRIYLPRGTAITSANRVKVTSRNRVMLGTAEYYSIVGAPIPEASAMVLTGKRIEGNADD